MSSLASYMANAKLTDGDMASLLGVSAEAVRLWRLRRRFPGRAHLARISEITTGEVTANDFVDQHTSPHPPEAA